jgi:hypothetical protein
MHFFSEKSLRKPIFLTPPSCGGKGWLWIAGLSTAIQKIFAPLCALRETRFCPPHVRVRPWQKSLSFLLPPGNGMFSLRSLSAFRLTPQAKRSSRLNPFPLACGLLMGDLFMKLSL